MGEPEIHGRVGEVEYRAHGDHGTATVRRSGLYVLEAAMRQMADALRATGVGITRALESVGPFGSAQRAVPDSVSQRAWLLVQDYEYGLQVADSLRALLAYRRGRFRLICAEYNLQPYDVEYSLMMGRQNKPVTIVRLVLAGGLEAAQLAVGARDGTGERIGSPAVCDWSHIGPDTWYRHNHRRVPSWPTS